MTKRRFTLDEGQWYAVEFLGDEFVDFEEAKYSPLRVISLLPTKTGKRVFKLEFYHANYPQGVQGKSYVLETIERGEEFMLAKSLEHTPARILYIRHIDWDWLHKHFGHLFRNQIEKNWTMENFLSRSC